MSPSYAVDVISRKWTSRVATAGRSADVISRGEISLHSSLLRREKDIDNDGAETMAAGSRRKSVCLKAGFDER